MPSELSKFRGTILVEDTRTERFFRELLIHLGFERHKLRFRPAPKGRGDAKAWIRAQSQYPLEVRILRKKSYERIFLITAIDGDNNDPETRKTQLDHALQAEGLRARQDEERIAIPVPTWSIETWLLALLDHEVDEESSKKNSFEGYYPPKDERAALREAARQWQRKSDRIPTVPSLADGKSEMGRIGV